MNENKCHWKWPAIKGSRNLKNRALKNEHEMNMKSKRKRHLYHLERTRKGKYECFGSELRDSEYNLHGAELIDSKI